MFIPSPAWNLGTCIIAGQSHPRWHPTAKRPRLGQLGGTWKSFQGSREARWNIFSIPRPACICLWSTSQISPHLLPSHMVSCRLGSHRELRQGMLTGRRQRKRRH